MVDLIGELLGFVFMLITGPNNDRWVIPIAIGMMASIMTLVALAFLLQ